MSEWIELKAGSDEPPVDWDDIVFITFRDGEISGPVRAGGLSWMHDGEAGDIVGYRLDDPTALELEHDSLESTKSDNVSGKKNSKYDKEIKGVTVDVYDVLKAFDVRCPALQHLVKKALQCGNRGHKTALEDYDDIIASAIRAKELNDD